jgi:flavin-dependent dehydrogenase
MTELFADVVVVGAGPAGAATALMLAPFLRTMLVDRIDPNAAIESGSRIGETLPAAAWRLLRDMGLWDDFLQQPHARCYSRRSIWGGPEPVSADGVSDPDGPGWHLDRARFDGWLRAWACRRGAALIAPAKATALRRDGDEWCLHLLRDGRPLTVTAPYVVDAGGRNAPLARMLGRKRVQTDRLVCRWLEGISHGDNGSTVVEAEAEGWWYTAALPEGRRMLAFHSDADLAAAKDMLTGPALLQRARSLAGIRSLLEATGFEARGEGGRCAAHSSSIGEVAGAGWIAVGDAALACDPLSSQGLFNALYSAFLAAGAVRLAFSGDMSGLSDYQLAIDRVTRAYRTHLTAWYGLETRWQDRPFWERRHRLSVGQSS